MIIAMDDQQLRQLVDTAIEAKGKAYVKYSRFPVGAALLCRDGKIFTGDRDHVNR